MVQLKIERAKMKVLIKNLVTGDFVFLSEEEFKTLEKTGYKMELVDPAKFVKEFSENMEFSLKVAMEIFNDHFDKSSKEAAQVVKDFERLMESIGKLKPDNLEL